MHLQINNKIITTPIEDILLRLQKELKNGKLRDIRINGSDNIAVTCPCHKGGYESTPSCFVYASDKGPNTQYGFAHCFTCGYTAPLPKFVCDCFNVADIEFGNNWLLENCDVSFLSEHLILPEIELESSETKNVGIDETILKSYEYYHDYMWKRKLTKEVVDLFEVGYDPSTNSITFPVRDERGVLQCVTSRAVDSKKFFIPKFTEKPVYLLHHFLKNNITTAVVCESQINALTCFSYGIPAIALFGTGTKSQYDILKKSGIRRYILMFDGDDAGRKGAMRFRKNMPSDVFIDDIVMPSGRDINDLTKEEFFEIFNNCNNFI